MANGRNQHIVRYAGAWAVRGAGNQRVVTRITRTQQEAINFARQIARNQR